MPGFSKGTSREERRRILQAYFDLNIPLLTVSPKLILGNW